MIEIWSPRYSTNTVLIAKYKVTNGANTVVFVKAKHLKGMEFTIEGSEIRKCPVESNGRIACYAVPMDKLRRSDENQNGYTSKCKWNLLTRGN